MKTHQLQLIPRDPQWKLDDHTREVGKAGLRNAREILRSTLATEAAAAAAIKEDAAEERRAA